MKAASTFISTNTSNSPSSSSTSSSNSNSNSEEEVYSPDSSTLASSISEHANNPNPSAVSVDDGADAMTADGAAISATEEDEPMTVDDHVSEQDQDQDHQDDGARAASNSASTPPSPASPSTPSLAPTPHVNIVAYPSADLLRLLASLLDQIARANDALNLRTSNAYAAATAASSSASSPNPSTSASPHKQQLRHDRESSEETSNNFERGRFDAAPLNSPVTPRRPPLRSESLASFTSIRSSVDGTEQELPVTPGIDLLREVGAAGSAEGFFPSLGGAHTPVPLRRRRGSSFKDKRDHPSSSKLANEDARNGASSSSSSSAFGPHPSSSSSSHSNSGLIAEEPPLTSLLTASSVALSSPSATLCFHARNIPAISIEAYLLRILKYCPTTNEVFLALLVYFDRMARVGLEAQRVGLTSSSFTAAGGPERLFAIDSFNVHRLVIAGVTVASKFFSDVFYTNSRYAKVGGLPLNELNQLELQFLLLNDFRLMIPVDELQRYADQLIIFWIGRNPPTPTLTSPILPPPPQLTASAVAAQNNQDAPHPSAAPSAYRPRSIRSQPSSSGTSTITPGTPSTTRGASESERGSDGEDEEDSPMDED